MSDGRVGKLKDAPDDDDEVRLEWADGSSSVYIHASKLSKGSETEWEAAQLRAAQSDSDSESDSDSDATATETDTCGSPLPLAARHRPLPHSS